MEEKELLEIEARESARETGSRALNLRISIYLSTSA